MYSQCLSPPPPGEGSRGRPGWQKETYPSNPGGAFSFALSLSKHFSCSGTWNVGSQQRSCKAKGRPHGTGLAAFVPGSDGSRVSWPPTFQFFPQTALELNGVLNSSKKLPTLLAPCSIILSWFRLGFRGLSPYSSGILFHYLSWFGLGFRGLSPYSFGILFHHPFLVPARVPGLLSLLFWHFVPSSFPGSARVPGLVSLLFWHFVPSSFPGSARVRGLVSLLFWHSVPSSVPGSG